MSKETKLESELNLCSSYDSYIQEYKKGNNTKKEQFKIAAVLINNVKNQMKLNIEDVQKYNILLGLDKLITNIHNLSEKGGKNKYFELRNNALLRGKTMQYYWSYHKEDSEFISDLKTIMSAIN